MNYTFHFPSRNIDPFPDTEALLKRYCTFTIFYSFQNGSGTAVNKMAVNIVFMR